MVRKQEMRGGGGGEHTLSVKVPSLFRCPISLDVMRSPVSLCTGVTYDRSSIQRWLESGNNTCPATMQPLPSTDLVPNLTLQRLINLWSQAGPIKHHPARALLAADPSPSSLRKLAAFFDDKDADEFDKNQLINNANNACADILSSIISNSLIRLEMLEEAVGVVYRILASECIEQANKQIIIAAVTSNKNLDESVSSLIRVLREGRSMETRANAAAVIDSFLTTNNVSNPKILLSLAEKKELIPELIRFIGEMDVDEKLTDAGLSCLVQLSGVRRARGRMVQLGMVPILTRILSQDVTTLSAETAEKAMKLMEAASGCSDGREAICEMAEATISAILKWTRKCGKGGTEAAAVVLWSVCHLFRDRRAQEAVEANGGLTKILVMMQSDCSPAARQMAGDLLKIFRVNSKCCLAGYDTKTTHIMPF